MLEKWQSTTCPEGGRAIRSPIPTGKPCRCPRFERSSLRCRTVLWTCSSLRLRSRTRPWLHRRWRENPEPHITREVPRCVENAFPIGTPVEDELQLESPPFQHNSQLVRWGTSCGVHQTLSEGRDILLSSLQEAARQVPHAVVLS